MTATNLARWGFIAAMGVPSIAAAFNPDIQIALSSPGSAVVSEDFVVYLAVGEPDEQSYDNNYLDVVATVDLPPNLTVVAVESFGGFTCAVSGSTLSCSSPSSGETNGMLSVGAVTLRAPAQPARLEFEADITTSTLEPDYNNHASLSTEVVATAAADLGITWFEGPAMAVPTERAWFIFGVNNNGPTRAKGCRAVFTIPAGAALVFADVNGESCTQDGERVICLLGDLATDRSAQGSIILSMPATTGSITTTLAASSDTLDPISENNTRTSNTEIVTPNAQMGLSLDVAPRVVTATPFSFTLTARNQGPTAHTDVTLAATLPEGLTHVAVTVLPTGLEYLHLGSASCTLSGTELACAVGTLLSGGSQAVTISATRRRARPSSRAIRSHRSSMGSTRSPSARS